jgi:putative copper resistance protein D
MSALLAVPAPSWAGVAGAWRPSILVSGVTVAAAGGYLAGVARIRRGGGSWPLGRTLSFVVLGLGGLVVTAMGWPAVYAPELFSVYAAQVTVLMLVVPFLLALGRPIGLAMAALPAHRAARLREVLDSRPAKLFTVPVVSPLLLAVIPFLIFFTPLFGWSLAHPVVLPILRVALLAIGLAVLLPMWEADILDARVPYALALLFVIIEMLADAVPGIVVRLDTHVLAAGYFAALGHSWGVTPLHDQQLGGDLLWCFGEAIDVPFLGMLVLQWVRSDARDAARIDRALDQAVAPASPPTTPRAPGDGFTRPWWETDASVFGDRAGRYERD